MKIFKMISPTLVVAIWSQSLVIYSRPVTTTVATTAPELRSESQLRSEASLYDAAIRELSKGTTIKLDTLDDLKAANALLAKQIPNLKFNRSKLVVLGLSETTFVNAVKERTRDSKSIDAFAKELANDPNSVFKLNGASALQSRLGRALETDVALLRAVAARLKKAAADLKTKINADHSTLRGAVPDADTRLKLAANVTNLISPQEAGNVVGAIVITTLVYVPGAFTLVAALAILAVGPLSLIGAAFILGKLVENVGTDKGRDKVAACEDAAKQIYDQCAANAAQQCCGLSVIFAADCLSDWLINAAACLVS
jgi:predicted phage tail protein